MKNYKKKLNLEKGFTLIELVVVMGVFLFVVGGAFAIFLSIVQNQRNILTEQQLLNQISYAEEYMSKALRMAAAEPQPGNSCLTDNFGDHPGYIYLLTRYDLGLGMARGIKFLNQSEPDTNGDPQCQEFYWDKNTGALMEQKYIDGDTEGSAVALTPTSLTIKSVRFIINGATDQGACANGACGASQCVTGSVPNTCIQPRVTILLNTQILESGGPVTRMFQTTVSQRNLNTGS